MSLTIVTATDRGTTVEGPNYPALQSKAIQQAIDPSTGNPVALTLPTIFFVLTQTSMAVGATQTIDAGSANRVLYISFLEISVSVATEIEVLIGATPYFDALLGVGAPLSLNFMTRPLRLVQGASAFFVKNLAGATSSVAITCWYAPLTN